MIRLAIATDGNFPTYGINFSGAGDIYTAKLTANSDTSTQVVPANARIAVFGFASGIDYWVSDAAITIPSSATFSANRAYLNPPPLIVTPGTTLYFKSATAAEISVAFYS